MKLGLNLKLNSRRSTGGSTTSLLLDLYPGAAAAYALVPLSNSYTGPVIRVRRSSDNTESDFTSIEITDGTLLGFTGVGNGFVAIYYDQSGNGVDLTQIAGNFQPQIVSSGALITSDGDPALLWDASNQLRILSGVAGNSSISTFYVYETSETNFITFSETDKGSKYGFVSTSGSTNTLLYSNFGTPSLYVNANLVIPANRGDVHTALSTGSTILQSVINASTTGWTDARIAAYTAFEYIGHSKLYVFYPSNQSANRTGIETAINSIYSIY